MSDALRLPCDYACDSDCDAACHQEHLPLHRRTAGACRCTPLRRRYAEAIRLAADYSIVGEWICCDPVNPDHKLCVKGDMARQMLQAVLADDPEVLFVPSGVVDAVMAVRDKRVEKLARDLRIAEMRSNNYEAEADRQRRRADHLAQAEAAVARVRQLHAEIPYKRGHCYCANPHPCPTTRALDPEGADRG